mmetsp:Transcript_57771/g.102534  ORF Transcript_57771/g.102534 Transcript_57771/m.102534 type:complete len:568 (+) Transcript_57771:80-1783(+)
MWFQNLWCCAPADEVSVPIDYQDLGLRELVSLAKSRLEHVLSNRNESMYATVEEARDVLAVAEQLILVQSVLDNRSSTVDVSRPSRAFVSIYEQSRPTGGATVWGVATVYQSRASTASQFEPAVGHQRSSSIDIPDGDDRASMAWIQETYSKTDIQSANISSSKAALKERQVLKADVSAREMASRIGVLKIQSLDKQFADQKVVAELRNARSLEFDSLKFSALPSINSHPLCPLAAHMVTSKGLVWALSESGRVSDDIIFRGQFFRFFDLIDGMYKQVPYHGVAHAADVLNTIGWLFVSEFFIQRMSALDRVVGLAAAAGHDAAHPGVSNSFLQKSYSELALRYNDQSILENMHASVCFETMKKHKSGDWLSLLPQKYQEADDQESPPMDLRYYCRKLMIDMILATDMAHHAQSVRELAGLAGELQAENLMNGGSENTAMKLEGLDRKLFMMKTAMHAADISNPCKARAHMLQWTDRVNQEFWQQGDQERKLGQSISPLCDREPGMEAIAKNQIGFYNFVIRPLYTPLAEIIPEARAAIKNLDDNEEFWREIDKKKTPYKDIFVKNT